MDRQQGRQQDRLKEESDAEIKKRKYSDIMCYHCGETGHFRCDGAVKIREDELNLPESRCESSSVFVTTNQPTGNPFEDDSGDFILYLADLIPASEPAILGHFALAHYFAVVSEGSLKMWIIDSRALITYGLLSDNTRIRITHYGTIYIQPSDSHYIPLPSTTPTVFDATTATQNRITACFEDY